MLIFSIQLSQHNSLRSFKQKIFFMQEQFNNVHMCIDGSGSLLKNLTND